MNSPVPSPYSRLLQAARRPEGSAPSTSIPSLHERRLEGMEAAERLRDQPRPR